DGRATLEDSNQMLEALLTGIGRLRPTNRVRHVTDKDDVLFLAFIRDGKVGVARNIRLNLDEIHASALQHVHGPAPVIGSRNRDGSRELSFWSVQHRAGNDHAGAKHGSRGRVATRGED